MKRLLVFFILAFIFFKFTTQVAGQVTPTPPIICGCPKVFETNIYTNTSRSDGGGKCVSDLATFQQDPTKNHLWIEDQEITDQGKADERARQFLFWVFKTGTIDYHPTLIKVWNLTRNVTFFSLLIVTALMGLGMMIGQKSNFAASIKIWPQIMRLMMLLLYVAISSTIVIGLIQLSDLLMKFFVETLGGKDLFNINFGVVSGEQNYINFVGCRDLNIRVQEGVKTQLTMLRLTNATYYVMGVMVILRKVLLWFLLFVSPFLALLLPFVFIRNVGWIWIGVFFQWLFYGPLFALFLGGLTTVWRTGIPFIFDFSRVQTDPTKCDPSGYVYPTAINILYGGPAQKLAPCSNANYADTFAEYIISLIMLWAVIFFPWWLLRIFRDYCCEGILAMKNILMSMYDQTRGGPSPEPSGPTPAPSTTGFGAAMKMPKMDDVTIKVKIETVEEIKRAKTEDISRSLDMHVSNLTDIARFETNKQTRQTVQKNINYLQNPIKADTPTVRMKYMYFRSELFTRAIKDDTAAKQILSSLSTSKVEQIQKRQELLKSVSEKVPVTHIVSLKVNVPQERVSSITRSYFKAVSSDNNALAAAAQKTNLELGQIKAVLTSMERNLSQPAASISQNVSKETNLDKEKVAVVIQTVLQAALQNKELSKKLAEEQGVKEEQLQKILEEQIPVITSPEKNVEKTISIPPSVSIEEYEQVKKMWKDQYDRGEVPISDKIKSRADWVSQDTVFITNTLNKLVSETPEVRQQGLDDLGYILPIFLINNLKGDQLLVYLKAKLEAAKEALTFLAQKEEIKKQVEKESEELVDVERPKTEEKEKVMEAKEEKAQ